MKPAVSKITNPTNEKAMNIILNLVSSGTLTSSTYKEDIATIFTTDSSSNKAVLV